MMGMMLMGAWLLIHQQCCVQGESSHEGRMRSAMLDPLMRRSPLEKNFMRFGRSWSPSDNSDTEAFDRFRKEKDNFIRFGRSFEDPDALDRPSRAKDNFMRFGRAKDNFMRFGRAKDNFMRFGRAKDNFMRFGRAKDNFMRFGRAKDNFMRFGRAKDNFMRFGRAKDNFMRFGRAKELDEKLTRASRAVPEENEDPDWDRNLVRIGRHRQSDKGDGFIRFGRSMEDENGTRDWEEDQLRKRRSADDLQREEDETKPDCETPAESSPLYNRLPDFIVAPELSLLPALEFKPKRTNTDRNFIRLG